MNMEKSNPTLIDVAKRAGVSIATASRVLSNADYPISIELKKKVIKASSELDYIPNVFGKMLRSNHTGAIGVIVPSLQNPFYNEVIFGIESAATNTGHEIRLFSSHRSIEQERSNIRNLLNSRVMALVIISIDTKPEVLNTYIEYGGKVAVLESDFELSKAISVHTDHFSAGQVAAKFLIDSGHRDIAFITSPLTKSFRRKIFVGVKQTLTDSGLKFSDRDLFVAHSETESNTGQYEFEIGRQLAEEILESHCKYTAIIAINDLTAFGAIQSLNQHGLSVPRDISIIGFDNIMYSEMISPPLTTVELQSSNMGYTACRLLISVMESGNDNLGDISLSFPYSLKQRESTAVLK